MADKNTVDSWSTTASDNDNIGGVPLGENVMKPSDVNNAFRALMSQVALVSPLGYRSQTLTAAQKAQARINTDTHILGEFRNKIINPLGAINQREKTGTVVLAANAYGHDRFKAGASGCTYTFSTSNGITIFNITSGTLRQIIEAAALEAGTYFLGWQGTAQGRINSGAYGATGVPTAALSGAANVILEWNVGTLSVPQFERAWLSDFNARHPQQELALARRYFWKPDQRWLVGGVATSANQTAYSTITHPVSMRVTPSITWSGITNVNTSGSISANVQGKDLTEITSLSAGAGSFYSLGTPSLDAEL